MPRLNEGDVLGRLDLLAIRGDPVPIPDPHRLVHLQFRRYAGCPVCNLHLQFIARRPDALLAAGLREVVVFHSRVHTMLQVQDRLPFAAVADPDKTLYSRFGVGRMSPAVALLPRSWRAAGRARAQAPTLRGATGKGEDDLGLPAEVLIAPEGRVLATRYGRYVDDHWSVNEPLRLARVRPPRRRHGDRRAVGTAVDTGLPPPPLLPGNVRSRARRGTRLQPRLTSVAGGQP